MQTVTEEEGLESLYEYLPNIQETDVFIDGTQPVQINGQQVFLTANGQIIEASNNLIQTNFLQDMGQPPQIPTGNLKCFICNVTFCNTPFYVAILKNERL